MTEHANSQHERKQALKITCAKLTEIKTKLLAKVVHLESHSRCKSANLEVLKQRSELYRRCLNFTNWA